MKITGKLLLVVASVGATALLLAQDGPPPGDNGPQGGGPGRQGGPPGQRRFPPIALIGALDANHDGVIDADEIANAVAALKKLDKNGDGKLTPDEFIGPRPGGPGGPGAPGGPDGQPGPDGPRRHRPEGQNRPDDRGPRPPGE